MAQCCYGIDATLPHCSGVPLLAFPPPPSMPHVYLLLPLLVCCICRPHSLTPHSLTSLSPLLHSPLLLSIELSKDTQHGGKLGVCDVLAGPQTARQADRLTILVWGDQLQDWVLVQLLLLPLCCLHAVC